MNILPKKRWHVRNRDNKERVRRDEENARLEEKKEQDRIALAEKEARISLLRKKSIVDSSNTNETGVQHATLKEGHINLFSLEDETGDSCNKDNVDYIKEKNAEKESYEKKIGLLTYVGQSSMEAKDDGKLWYTEKKAKIDNQNSDSEVDQCKKLRLDPLMVVEKHMKHKKSMKEHKKKKKKEKDKPLLPSSSSKSIEKLREERLMREKVERQRTNELLNNDKVSHTSEDARIGNDRGKYFSQYNPDLARRKRDR